MPDKPKSIAAPGRLRAPSSQGKVKSAELGEGPGSSKRGELRNPKAQERLWNQWDQLHGDCLGRSRKRSEQKSPTRKDSYLVSIINQKGRTGKTTTTINLG
jgi:hypothetical protein